MIMDRVSRRILCLSMVAVAVVVTAAPAQETTRRTGRAPVAVHLVPENRQVVGQTRTDAHELTVGDPFWVNVVTRGPAGYFLLPQTVIDAYAPHPELAVLASDRRDGRMRLQIALFRPGDVVLPEVEARVVTDIGDTLTVPVTADTIHVASVLAPGDTLLADIKPLWKREGLPAWVWWLLAALLVLAALAWWYWRRRKTGDREAWQPKPDAFHVARDQIAVYREDPPTPPQRLTAAAGIGDALRSYLADAWGIPARESTSFELLSGLPHELESGRASLGSTFNHADLAKYARLAPEAGEVPGIAGRALEWLDVTEEARRVEASQAEEAVS